MCLVVHIVRGDKGHTIAIVAIVGMLELPVVTTPNRVSLVVNLH
jgi:hypothetical protein